MPQATKPNVLPALPNGIVDGETERVELGGGPLSTPVSGLGPSVPVSDVPLSEASLCVESGARQVSERRPRLHHGIGDTLVRATVVEGTRDVVVAPVVRRDDVVLRIFRWTRLARDVHVRRDDVRAGVAEDARLCGTRAPYRPCPQPHAAVTQATFIVIDRLSISI